MSEVENKDKVYTRSYNMKLRVLLCIFLFSNWGLFAQDMEWEDPTFAGLRPLPEYSKGQTQIMDLLSVEITALHKDIEKRLNFLQQGKKIVDGKFVQTSSAREQFEYPIKNRYVVDHKAILQVAGTGDSFTLTNVEFITRKSRDSKQVEHPQIKIMKIVNNPADTDWSKFMISIKKLTPSGQSIREINISKLYDPLQRVEMARVYKNKLTEIVIHIDRQIASVGVNEFRDLRFIQSEMNVDSGYIEE